MMSDPCILACDIGTSSIKTVLFRTDGQVIGSASRPVQTRQQQAGWADQDPDEWWLCFRDNVSDLMERFPDCRQQIAVIGVSGHMLGILAVDADGKPLAPALIHADTRAIAQARQIRKQVGDQSLYERTGNILESRSSLCKLLWFKQERPEIYGRTARFLQSKDYLTSLLTGNIDSTDLSDASHAQWINLQTRTYLDDVFNELDLDLAKMPTVRRGIDLAGTLTAAKAGELGLTAGIPVVVGAGDGCCASVGAGSALSGNFYCCLGTTAWIAFASPNPIIDRQRRLFNMFSADGKTCGVYGTTQAAGLSVTWGMDLFKDQDLRAFDRQADQIAPGSDGLIFLPYLQGERTPVFDADARAVFFGVASTHTQDHFRRAILEGVALALRDIIQIYREKTDVHTMRLIGGGAKSDLWRKIIADTCGLTLERLTAPAGDATSLGIALTAAVGIGIYPDLKTAQATIGVLDRQKPNPAATAVYNQIYPVYKNLYQVNKPLFDQLSQIRQSQQAVKDPRKTVG